MVSTRGVAVGALLSRVIRVRVSVVGGDETSIVGSIRRRTPRRHVSGLAVLLGLLSEPLVYLSAAAADVLLGGSR